MWFSSLWLFAREAGRTLVKPCKVRKRMKQRVIKSFHRSATAFWMIGWPGVGSCPARDLHCRAELLQKLYFRRCHGCYHRAGVVLQVFDRSDSPERCKVQVLAKGLETNDHVTHLNLDGCEIEVEGIKVGEPGVGSGFRCRSAIRLL